MRTFGLDITNIEDLKRATGDEREFRATQMGAKLATGRLSSVSIGGLAVTHAKFDSDMLVHSTFHNQKSSLALFLEGQDITALGHRLKPGDVLTTGPGAQNDGRYKSPMEYVMINFDSKDLTTVSHQRSGVRLIRTGLSLPPNAGTYAEQSWRHSERAVVPSIS